MFKNFINIYVIAFYGLVNGQTNFSSNETEIKISELCFSTNCPTLCTSWRIDAVLNYRNGTIFAFKGNYFWKIFNESKPPMLSNAYLITKYWNTRSKNGKINSFKGPIDAAFKDDKGYTYFFKKNKIFTFKEFSFIGSQTVASFDSIDSAILVNRMKDNESNVYIFKGSNYWQILPIRKMYDFLEISSIFKFREIGEINRDFPVNIDAAFQDDNNNIIIMKGPQYIKIPAHHFPNSIKENDLIPKFIFNDILGCSKWFYEITSFASYDQFLMKLISHGFNHMKVIPSTIEFPQPCPEEKAYSQSTNYWSYIMIGVSIGVALTVLLQYLFVIRKRQLKSFNKNQLIDTNSRVSVPQNVNSGSIDLIRQNQISVDI